MASCRKVQPGPIQPSPSTTDLSPNFLQRTLRYVTGGWHQIQIGNRVYYSVERVLAFRDYCERTSQVRAFGVCVLTPAPAAIVMLLIECIPLVRPEEGWKANYMFWIRVLVSAVFVGGGIVFLTKTVVDESKISTTRAFAIAFVSAICYTAMGITLAATWKYPVPFGMVLMVCPFVSIILTLILVSIGPHELKTNAKLQKQLVGHIIGISAQSLLVVAYPTFNAIFLHLSGIHQALFIFVLPVIKFTTKQIIARVATHLEDYLGAVIIFSVDVFNVLYVAICMQTARSSLTTVLVVSYDVVHILFAIRSIYYHTNLGQNQSKGSPNNLSYVNKLIASFDKLKARAKPYTGPIRLMGPYRLPLSDVSVNIVEALKRRWNPQCLEKRMLSPERAVAGGSLAGTCLVQGVGPTALLIPLSAFQHSPLSMDKCDGSKIGSEIVTKPRDFQVKEAAFENGGYGTKTYGVLDGHHSTHKLAGSSRRPVGIEKVIEEGLQALFHCEYVILSEYIECILPLVYAIYLGGLYQLPTAAFYPFTSSQAPDKMTSTLIQLMIYGSLEFISFIGLHVLLRKRLGYSPIYQLAFVLETHAVMLQSLLFVWILFIVQLTLVHSGKVSEM
ncbi:unnamed protein product [Phytophthora lilii]|uniref:Unnamed protein product n=1 Tax=Phytophthora lilii TaxID=2077276 RepID=A0A9W6U9J3_9STRA|nr:unnamed protein product [Phytophthora lilii]